MSNKLIVAGIPATAPSTATASAAKSKVKIQAEREVWAVWRMDEDEVRVQVNRPDLAKAFAKVKTARSVGYSVFGNYMRLYHVKESVPWVDAWMKKFIRTLSVKPKLN